MRGGEDVICSQMNVNLFKICSQINVNLLKLQNDVNVKVSVLVVVLCN